MLGTCVLLKINLEAVQAEVTVNRRHSFYKTWAQVGTNSIDDPYEEIIQDNNSIFSYEEADNMFMDSWQEKEAFSCSVLL